MNKLDELIAKYNNYVQRDHHKSRDCHFYINKVWNYGECSGWTAYHLGYINEFESPVMDTYEKAERWLIDKLEELTKPEEWEWQE